MLNFNDPKRDLVVLTTESSWDEPPRMRHYVAQQLASFFNVLYCEIHSKGLPCTRKVSDSLIVRRVGGYIRGVHRLRATKALYDVLQTQLIIINAKNYKAPRVILFNFRFDFWRIYRSGLFDLKYFLLNDDFVNMNRSDTQSVREFKQILQNKVVSLSDRVFTSSDPLADDVRGCAAAVSVIYSGHNFDKKNNRPRFDNGKINVCFMGFICGNLEICWIEELAKEKDVRIVFVGPVSHKETFKILSKHKNIEFHPPMLGRELQTFLSSHDVFIMPYTTELINTKATVPAKLFQYMACGRPVVSNILPSLISLPDCFVYQADSAKEFVQMIYKAYGEDNSVLFKARINYANGHHWNTRGLELKAIISEDLSAV